MRRGSSGKSKPFWLVGLFLLLPLGQSMNARPVPLDLLRFDPLKVNPVRPLVAAVTGMSVDQPWDYQVQVFDFNGQVVTNMPVGKYPLALGWNGSGNKLYVIFGQEEVGVIDFTGTRIVKKKLGRSESGAGEPAYINDILGRANVLLRSEEWMDPAKKRSRRLWSLFPYQEGHNKWSSTPLFEPLPVYRHALLEPSLDQNSYVLIKDNCVKSLDLDPVRFRSIWCSSHDEVWPVKIAANEGLLSAVLNNGAVLLWLKSGDMIRIGSMPDKPITSMIPLPQGLLWTGIPGLDKLHCLSTGENNRVVRKVDEGIYAMKAGHGKVFIQTYTDRVIVLDGRDIRCGN